MRAMRRLEKLLKAREALDEAMREAADDVLEEAQMRRPGRPRAHVSGRIAPYDSDAFERYVRRAWAQAKTEEHRGNVREMVRKGLLHGLLDGRGCPELLAELGLEP